MKLIIERDPFFKALRNSDNLIEKRTTVPILSHVLLKAADNKLSLTTTDMEIGIIESTPAEIHREGSAAVPVRRLYSVVKSLKEGVRIELDYDSVKGIMTLKAARANFEFSCLPAEEFPAINIEKLPYRFPLPAKDIFSLFERTRFAMSTEESRYSLNGVHFHAASGNELRAVATDGHRLAKVTVSLPSSAANLPGVIIPRKTVYEVISLLADTVLDVDIALSDSQISFNIGDVYLTSRLIDAQYPEYEAVIPKTNEKALTMHVRPFREAVARVAIMASEKEKGIKLKLTENQLELSSASSESGSAIEEMSVEYANDDMEIGFNANYLIEIAHQINSEEAEILLSDTGSPAIIRDLNDTQSLYVLMPMRV